MTDKVAVGYQKVASSNLVVRCSSVMTSDSEKNWVRHQHHQRREDAPVSKGLPFMVMYITGATRRLRNPGRKGACISRLAPRTLWRPCTVARPKVASLRFVLISVRFVAAICQEVCEQPFHLRRGAPPPYLVSQVRSGVHCRICSRVRCRVHFGGRIRLRSRVCSRVVGENINASAQQRI